VLRGRPHTNTMWDSSRVTKWRLQQNLIKHVTGKLNNLLLIDLWHILDWATEARTVYLLTTKEWACFNEMQHKYIMPVVSKCYSWKLLNHGQHYYHWIQCVENVCVCMYVCMCIHTHTYTYISQNYLTSAMVFCLKQEITSLPCDMHVYISVRW
jgi:hypothetical protein